MKSTFVLGVPLGYPRYQVLIFFPSPSKMFIGYQFMTTVQQNFPGSGSRLHSGFPSSGLICILGRGYLHWILVFYVITSTASEVVMISVLVWSVHTTSVYMLSLHSSLVLLYSFCNIWSKLYFYFLNRSCDL